MRNLDCKRIELDEVWGFIGKKKANVTEYDHHTFGDVWTYCAIDAETKLVPAYKVASTRNVPITIEFIADLKSRLKLRSGGCAQLRKPQLCYDASHDQNDARNDGGS
jgi:hypothetical protein